MIRSCYVAVWRSLFSWFLRTNGEGAAETFTGAAMGAASFFHLLTILWVAQIAHLIDIVAVLSGGKVLLALIAILLMFAHFHLARYVNRIETDRSGPKPSSENVSPALGLTY